MLKPRSRWEGPPPPPHARPTTCRLAITPKKQDSGFALELRLGGGWFKHMPMTLDQIVEEARHLPTEQVVELVGRLAEGLHLSPGIEESWKAETRRRVADIEAGKVQGIPGPEVSARTGDWPKQRLYDLINRAGGSGPIGGECYAGDCPAPQAHASPAAWFFQIPGDQPCPVMGAKMACGQNPLGAKWECEAKR